LMMLRGAAYYARSQLGPDLGYFMPGRACWLMSSCTVS
jgi:hypothetical protein